jgi:hypothetical protein
MPFNFLLSGVMLFYILAAPLTPGTRQPAITAANNQAVIAFPNKITFQVDLNSSAEISEVTLEYGVQQMTCGKLVAKTFPDFQPAKTASVAWSWEMKQSGSLPPGAKIWWRWHVTDAAGSILVTDEQMIIWLDDTHPWKTLSQGDIRLHWYQGGDSFGQDLLDNGVQSLESLDKNIGLKPDGAIDLYIYASPDELTEAVYFMPDWTGGLAYPENNIVLIGIAEDEMTWGKHAETHELTHVLAGRLTFSCLGDLPTWLNEGLAKYSEGDWDENARKQLGEAIKKDELISVRALSSSFPEDADKARQAYAQSQSLVTFLIEEYQQDQLLRLLSLLSQGTTTDKALKEIYGFDQDGLEDAWRTKVNAQPRAAVETVPTAVLTPTPIPTIVPVSDVPAVIALSPTRSLPEPDRAPTVVSPNSEDEGGQAGRGLRLLLICGGCFCAVAVLVIVAAVLFFALKNKKG